MPTRIASEPDDSNLVILYVICVVCFFLLVAIAILLRNICCPQLDLCECTWNQSKSDQPGGRRRRKRSSHGHREDLDDVERFVDVSKLRHSRLPRGGHRAPVEETSESSTSPRHHLMKNEAGHRQATGLRHHGGASNKAPKVYTLMF